MITTVFHRRAKSPDADPRAVALAGIAPQVRPQPPRSFPELDVAWDEDPRWVRLATKRAELTTGLAAAEAAIAEARAIRDAARTALDAAEAGWLLDEATTADRDGARKRLDKAEDALLKAQAGTTPYRDALARLEALEAEAEAAIKADLHAALNARSRDVLVALRDALIAASDLNDQLLELSVIAAREQVGNLIGSDLRWTELVRAGQRDPAWADLEDWLRQLRTLGIE